MERTKSLSERDAKRHSSSPPLSSTSASNSKQPQSHSRELQRTSSLGLDLICKQLSWLRPSPSNVSCSVQPSSAQNLPSPSGQTTLNAQHTSSHSHLSSFVQFRQIASEGSQEERSASKNFPNYELIENLMHELRSRSVGSLEGSLRIIDDLASAIRTQPLNEQAYSKIIRDTAELLERSQPTEVRHKVWRLYTQLVQGRAENVGQLRYLLFDLIHKNDARPEDIPYRIDFLIALTDCGKTLLYYEEDMAQFMIDFYSKLVEKRTNIEWKVKTLQTEVQKNFLKFMTELVKYNAPIMSKALNTMIHYVCSLAFDSNQLSEMQAIYSFLNVVLCYAHLPMDSLNQFVIVNCIGVNREELRQTCIQVMRNLIGTYLGFASLSALNHIIEDETNYNDKVLIRGAVFFLVQSLWGDLSNEKVFISPNSVLPAFKNLILNESIATPYIALEVANGILVFLSNVLNPSDQRRQSQSSIITKSSEPGDDFSGKIIFECTWELVLDICHLLVGVLATKEAQTPQLVCTIQCLIEKLKMLLRKIISHDFSSQSESSFQLSESISIALLMSDDKFVPKLFAILELGINYLSDESIFKLIAYKLNYIGNYPNWTSEMKHMIEVFYKANVNSVVRIQFLSELERFLENNSHFVSIDVFWDKVASSYFIQSEPNCPELADTIKFLLYLAKKSNSTKHLSDIIGILEKMATFHLKAFFQRQHSVEFTGGHHQARAHSQVTHQLSAPNQSDHSPSDPVQSINGLIVIFREKLDHPTCYAQAINAFNLVIRFYSQFLKVHPTHELDLHSHVQMRTKTVILLKQKIFEMILSLRSNSMGQLGVVIPNPQQQTTYSAAQLNRSLSYEEVIKFTSFIVLCDSRQISPPTSPLQSQLCLQQPTLPQRQPLQGSTVSSSFQTALYEALIHVLDCIRMETEWSVLELVFDKLAKMLKNKGLILSLGKYPSASSPTPSLVHLKTEPSFPDLVVNVLDKFIDNLATRLSDFVFSDTKMAKADVLTHVYLSISELVGYNLHSTNQNLVIKCLKSGFVQFSSKPHCIRQCIISLTICSMEMQTMMNKFLKDIILTLSQIATNKILAVPKLEFLSNIILFPDLYYTFTQKQYWSVFSIALQYINPYKYGEYAVVLALRVISMWFLRCPSPYRLQLMKFLNKGLNTNILKEVEPTTPQLTSQRLTSLSLSSEHRTKLENRLLLTSSPPPPPTTPVNVSSQFSFSFQSSASATESHHPNHSLTSSASSAFNVCANTSPQMINEGSILDPNDKEKSKVELVEVCMDMFSTNAFNTSSPLPLKPSMIDKLLNRQKSQMWMIGHKIIQITTTGCSSRAIRNGLCNKCFHICHLNQKDSSSTSMDDSNSLSSTITQTNAFSDRASFSTQLSYDQHSSTTIAASSRRRHQSEIGSSNSKMKNSLLANDDFFMKRTQVSSSDPDLDNSAGNKYCRCWCQGWAEILIRRSTGNTRWIMRVENNLGDFPYWCYSKEEDDSLANLFSHADPEINLALKLQKAAEMEPEENIDISDEGQTMSQMIHDTAFHHSVSTFESNAQRPRASMPVTRAASFGSRRPAFQTTFLDQQTPTKLQDIQVIEHARTQVIRRLEKNYSVDEDEPPASLLSVEPHVQVSPVASTTSSSDTVKDNFSASNYRERSTTISVMSPVQKSASSTGVSGGGMTQASSMYDASKSTSTLSLSSNRPSISSGALSPQSVFLQLYYNTAFKEVGEISMLDKPILLDKNDALVRAISVLDRTTPYETHKIGVLYIGPGQVNSKVEILANQMGSFRYTMFLQKLGHTIKLEDVDSNVCYTGGLDTKKDGPFAISWGDHLVQAIFHVATFMPTLKNDPNCNNKMVHIGNDFICIVYNNSGQKFDISTIKGEGQFLQAMVVITPLEHESNSVQIYGMTEFIDFIGHTEAQIISDNSLSVYVRQLALHANIAAMVKNSNKHQKSYNISNWITRLQSIKRIRTRAIESLPFPYNPELVHSVRSSHPLQAYSRGRQSSRDEADSVISSSVASPNIPGSAGPGSASVNGAFDYDSTKLAYPDFCEFLKELNQN